MTNPQRHAGPMPGCSSIAIHGCQTIEQRWRDPHSFGTDGVYQVGLPLEPARGILRSALEILEDAGDLRAADQHELAEVLFFKARTLPIKCAQLEFQGSYHLERTRSP